MSDYENSFIHLKKITGKENVKDMVKCFEQHIDHQKEILTDTNDLQCQIEDHELDLEKIKQVYEEDLYQYISTLKTIKINAKQAKENEAYKGMTDTSSIQITDNNANISRTKGEKNARSSVDLK